MGRSRDNNNVLYYLMEAIAMGHKDWSSIRNYIDKNMGLFKRGIVFPNDKSLLILDFIDRVE
jgi:hypothetical protein